MAGRLEGKIAVVTGSGNNIGREIARRFAQEGAAVVVADLDEAAAKNVASEITGSGQRAIPCRVDIRDTALIEAMFSLTLRELGALDILINNAGISSQHHFLDTPLETWRNMLDVNLTGTFLCAQIGAREMAKLKRGRIVNFTSHSGLLGSSGRGAYAAAKGGIIALTRVMAVDLAQYNISVNAIAPGPIEVPRDPWRKQSDERRAAWHKAIPLARLGTVQEVAATALFLASDEASFINGQTIAVDGGFTAAGLRVTQLNPITGHREPMHTGDAKAGH